ncbi:hypothetical protein [Lysinibacillus irui]|uniref:Uncharacterized protein n=1 Tax=Lysinibacillus irui TaxID=2998077 RepID=A0AAJ5RU84_9BACI|nr:hypothetical protein [Lysinibacillus irui]WDV09269.1 hypothetical protein OU989_23560 [Lysinibacillus irui]
MKKAKVYFTIPCRNKIWLFRSLLLGKASIFLIEIYILSLLKLGYLVSTVIIFLTFFLLKFVPMPYKDTIDVYFDRLIYKSKYKEIELNFSDIAFIDQDVVDEQKSHSYYKSIEFLDESMNSLLFIDGSGYAYDDLVVLCNRICTINQEYLPFKKSSSNPLEINFNENEIV